MALVKFEDYSGTTVEINPAAVLSVSSYQHFDYDFELPEEFYVTNPSGLKEVSNDPKKMAEADKLRTSERVIVSFTNGSSTVVKGTVDEVKKAIGTEDKEASATRRAPSAKG